jgi:hypothetical protein
MITDSDDTVVAFEKTFWYGTWVNMDATLYKYTSGPNTGKPLPAALSANNVIQVDKGDLTIERHGNNMVASLNEQVTIKRAFLLTTFTLPAFTVELTSFGRSFFDSNTVAMTGWPGATGYTIIHNAHGFYANGVFNSQGTYLNNVATVDSAILMQGTHTFLKPSTT